MDEKEKKLREDLEFHLDSVKTWNSIWIRSGATWRSFRWKI